MPGVSIAGLSLRRLSRPGTVPGGGDLAAHRAARARLEAALTPGPSPSGSAPADPEIGRRAEMASVLVARFYGEEDLDSLGTALGLLRVAAVGASADSSGLSSALSGRGRVRRPAERAGEAGEVFVTARTESSVRRILAGMEERAGEGFEIPPEEVLPGGLVPEASRALADSVGNALGFFDESRRRDVAVRLAFAAYTARAVSSLGRMVDERRRDSEVERLERRFFSDVWPGLSAVLASRYAVGPSDSGVADPPLEAVSSGRAPAEWWGSPGGTAIRLARGTLARALAARDNDGTERVIALDVVREEGDSNLVSVFSECRSFSAEYRKGSEDGVILTIAVEAAGEEGRRREFRSVLTSSQRVALFSHSEEVPDGDAWGLDPVTSVSVSFEYARVEPDPDYDPVGPGGGDRRLIAVPVDQSEVLVPGTLEVGSRTSLAENQALPRRRVTVDNVLEFLETLDITGEYDVEVR